MVKIRLKRLGRKKRPFYRIVVVDIRTRRQGAPLAELGYYNPMSRELKLDKVSATSWIEKGAQPSETAERLIKLAPETGEVIVLERVRKERLSKKAEAAQKAAAEAAAQKAEEEAAAKQAAAAAPEAPAEESPAAEAEPEAESEAAAE